MRAELTSLCCYGAGGHGKVVAHQWHARHGGTVAFADEGIASGSQVGQFKVHFSSVDQIHGMPLIITIGDNARRAQIQQHAEKMGLKLSSFVASPEMYFAEAPGLGSVVLAGAVVNPGASIERGVIVNSGAVIEHDCSLAAFVHVSPNATLTGGVKIGSGTWIGAGATVLPGLSIAAGCIIGAGAVVTSSIDLPGTYVGVPARGREG